MPTRSEGVQKSGLTMVEEGKKEKQKLWAKRVGRRQKEQWVAECRVRAEERHHEEPN